MTSGLSRWPGGCFIAGGSTGTAPGGSSSEGLPFLVMLGVMAIVVYFYYRYNPRRRLRPAPPDVSPGLILALSLLAIRPGSPFQSVEDLNTALNTPDKTLGRRLF